MDTIFHEKVRKNQCHNNCPYALITNYNKICNTEVVILAYISCLFSIIKSQLSNVKKL